MARALGSGELNQVARSGSRPDVRSAQMSSYAAGSSSHSCAGRERSTSWPAVADQEEHRARAQKTA